MENLSYGEITCELEKFLVHAKDYGSELAGPPECYCKKCCIHKLKKMRTDMGTEGEQLIVAHNKIRLVQKQLDSYMGQLANIIDEYEDDRKRDIKRKMAEGNGEKSS